MTIDIAGLAAAALQQVSTELALPEPIRLSDETDLFAQVDSFTIVDLLLETEQQLEAALGRYVPLGDEAVFDAEKSPLRRWANWVAHIGARCHDA